MAASDTLTVSAPHEGLEAPAVRWLRRLVPLLLTASSAGLLALASPPYGWAWAAWIAPAPFFLALLQLAQAEAAPTRGLKRRAFGLGIVHGFLFLMLLVPWFAAFTPAGYPVAGVYWGLLSGLIAALLVWLLRRTPAAWAPPLLAGGWTVLEWLRAQGVLAFPWGTLAATQYRHLEVIQVVDLSGAYGLSFVMALVAAGLAVVFHDARPLRQAGTRWLAAALLLAVACVGRGAWLLRNPTLTSGTARVAVVQASESVKTTSQHVVCVSPPERYEALSAQAVAEGAELVVWPESASTTDAVHSAWVHSRLRELLRGSRTTMLVGSFVRDPESGMDTNAAVLLSPEAQVLGQYAKVLIVPFGEYLPARRWLGWTERLGMPNNDLRAGQHWSPLPWRAGGIGTSICFESAFGYVSRRMTSQGADLLAVLTSDGWAGRSTAGRQHATFAPLRAVENRRSVARAAATGVSQLIDPYGRPLTSIPMFEKGYSVADLPVRRDLTLYTRLGDWPVGLSWLLLFAAVVYAVRRGRAHQG